MKKFNAYEHFKQYAVDATSLDDFLKKYTKHSRHEGRGSEYVAARIESHKADIEKYGFTFITHHDSTIGETAAYYPN